MTLRHFLDAAYVALVEEYRRIGSDLQSALKELEIYRAGGPSEEGPVEPGTALRPRQEAATATENERSLMELQKMLAATSFGG